jgi:hypothetical protein
VILLSVHTHSSSRVDFSSNIPRFVVGIFQRGGGNQLVIMKAFTGLLLSMDE